MQYINLNGKIVAESQAAVTVNNSAFRYGYGLYETMLAEGGVIRMWAYHWERLSGGVSLLYGGLPPVSMEDMEREILRTVAENTLTKRCRVRLQVYAYGDGLYCAENVQLRYAIECFAVEGDTRLNEEGLVVGIAGGIQKAADALSNLKTSNSLMYAMAAKAARARGWDDAFVCNIQGNIAESSIANVFWIKDGIIFTPPLADGCVAGVMRRHVMERVKVVEKSLSKGELDGADEVFLTNAIRGIRWVKSIGTINYRNEHVKRIYQQVYGG